MNKEEQELIDEVYNKWIKYSWNSRIYPNQNDKDIFIDRIKTEPEFSEKWGLKIEERELSLEERMDLINKMHLRSYSGWQNWSVEEMEDRMNNDWNIPTRLITITYKDKTLSITT